MGRNVEKAENIAEDTSLSERRILTCSSGAHSRATNFGKNTLVSWLLGSILHVLMTVKMSTLTPQTNTKNSALLTFPSHVDSSCRTTTTSETHLNHNTSMYPSQLTVHLQHDLHTCTTLFPGNLHTSIAMLPHSIPQHELALHEHRSSYCEEHFL